MLRGMFVSLALALFGAVPAQADVFPAPLGYSAEAPTTSARLVQLADFANQFWSGQTPQGCDAIAVFEADDVGVDESGRDAGGKGGSCVIAFRRDTVANLTAATATHNYAARVQALAFMCADVVHETGHARGLPHLPYGVMMAGVGPTPPACDSWAITAAGPKAPARTRRHLNRTRSHRTHRGVSGSSVG